MTVFVLVFLPLTISLGFWQVSRGAQKRALEEAYLASLGRLPVAVSAMTRTDFERVRLSGRYGHEVFLVDNQVRHGVTGYWLIQSFYDTSGDTYLVNRGFIAGSASRATLPSIDSPPGDVVLVGALWPFLGLIPVLDDDRWAPDWPKRVQRLDIARMANAVSARPFEIRLEPGAPGVQNAAPFAARLDDATHRGYAATWFGLAGALLVAYVVFGLRAHK